MGVDDTFRRNFCRLSDEGSRELDLGHGDDLPKDPGLVVLRQLAAIEEKAVRIMKLMLVDPDVARRIGLEVSLKAI